MVFFIWLFAFFIVYILPYKGTYGLSDTQDVYTPYIKECKTVTAAKRWATMYQNRFFLDKDE